MQSFYHDKSISQVLCQAEFPSFDLYQRLLLTERARAIQPGELTLDLGAGEGIHSLRLAKSGATTIAADLSRDALEMLKEMAYHYKVELSPIVCDGLLLPFKSGAFDSVYCLETLEHVPDDRGILKEIQRILGEGGEFVLSVPNSGFPLLWDPKRYLLQRRRKLSLEETNLIGSQWPGIGPFLGHLRTYSEPELTEKVREARLSKIRSYACGHLLLAILLMILKAFLTFRSPLRGRDRHQELLRSPKARAVAKIGYDLLRIELILTMILRVGVTLCLTGYKDEKCTRNDGG